MPLAPINRTLIAALAGACALLAGGVGTAQAGPQGCVVSDPPNPGFENPCTYRAGAAGSYAAYGRWWLRVERGARTIELSSARGSAPVGLEGAILPGDLVTARVQGPGSSLFAGNPSPTAASSPSQPVPPHTTVDGEATSFDGARIVYRLHLPAGASASNPAPAVVAGHGWGGNRHGYDPDFNPQAQALVRAGYALLTFDSRGWGESGGQAEIDVSAFEGRDVKALVDVLAADDRISRNRAGDPRVGMFGESYAGGVQYAAAAIDPRIDAITPQDSWNDAAAALAPQGIPRDKALAALTAVAENAGARVNPMIRQAAVDGAAYGALTAPVRDYLSSRGPHDLLGELRTPTLVLHNLVDGLFAPSEGIRNFRALTSARARKLVLFCGFVHGTCGPYDSSFDVMGPVLAFLDRWVKGDTNVRTGPVVEYVTQEGSRRGAAAWPVPRTARKSARGSGIVTTPGEQVLGNGIDPAAFVPPVLPVRPQSPAGQPPRAGATTLKVPLGLRTGSVVAGAPHMTVRYTANGGGTDGSTVLFLRVVDTTTGRVLGHQETPRRFVTDGAEHVKTFRIEPVTWLVEPGDELALEIVPGSANYAPERGAAAVRFHRVRWSLPVVPTTGR